MKSIYESPKLSVLTIAAENLVLCASFLLNKAAQVNNFDTVDLTGETDFWN